MKQKKRHVLDITCFFFPHEYSGEGRDSLPQTAFTTVPLHWKHPLEKACVVASHSVPFTNNIQDRGAYKHKNSRILYFRVYSVFNLNAWLAYCSNQTTSITNFRCRKMFSYSMKISYRKLAVSNFHTTELLKLTT